MTEEKTCYVSRVILSLVSLQEDLSFETVLKDWSFNKDFIHPSKLYASKPSRHRSQVRIRLWLMEALYLYVWKIHPIP